MTSENLLIVCRSCGRKVLMHNMRPDGTGENMVCIDCYKRNSPTKTMSISEAAAEQTPKPVKRPERTEEMRKYICTACKYKFSRKKTQEVSKCPYCGKNSIVLDSGLGADKLLKDSADRRFENW
jgi:DNA-directed RNA polymerase subunit RPC12/RpoP